MDFSSNRAMVSIVVLTATPWYPAKTFRVPGDATTIARDDDCLNVTLNRTTRSLLRR
jgi:hypothetical protein